MTLVLLKKKKKNPSPHDDYTNMPLVSSKTVVVLYFSIQVLHSSVIYSYIMK